MKASRLTVQRLLNRLPSPARAQLQDLGHAAAMVARGRLAPQPHTADLAERLAGLEAWIDTATTGLRPTRPKGSMSTDAHEEHDRRRLEAERVLVRLRETHGRAFPNAPANVCRWSFAGDGITLDELRALDGKTLGCFCAPKACHGDVLAQAVAWALAQPYTADTASAA